MIRSRFLFQFVILLAIATLISACNYHRDKKSGRGDAAGGKLKIESIEGDKVVLKTESGETKEIKSNEIKYDLISKAVLGPYCMKCHHDASAAQGSDFTSFEKVKKWAPRILVRMGNQTMPPSGDKPSSAEIKAFELWVSNGNPE